jgi:hypothetical protein
LILPGATIKTSEGKAFFELRNRSPQQEYVGVIAEITTGFAISI